MRTEIAIATALILALSSATVGCSDDDTTDTSQHDAGSSPDAGKDVKCPSDLPEFAANPTSGLEATVTHETLHARLIDANPVHPAKNKRNDWTVQFEDDQGKALDDVQLVASCAYMRVHGHGTPPLEGTKMLSGPGQYELDYLSFTMRGPWEVQLVVNRTGAAAGPADDMDASAESDAGEMAARPIEFTDCDRSRSHPGAESAIFHFCVPNE